MKKIVTISSIILTLIYMELLAEPHPKSDFYLPIINTPQRPFLKWLCDGTKTAEGRVYRATCKKMKKGATIVLEDKRRNEWIYGRIKFLHRYASFRKMLEREGVNHLLPFLGENDIEKGIQVYESFPGGKGVLREGCVAIGIAVQKNNFGEPIRKTHEENGDSLE